MIDPALLKEDSYHLVKKNMEKRLYFLEEDPFDVISTRKKVILQIEEHQHERNTLSKDIGKLKLHARKPKENTRENEGNVTENEINSLKNKVNEISEKIRVLKEEKIVLEEKYQSFLLFLPNMLDDSVPQGKGEEDNVVIRQVGDIPKVEAKPHYEVAHDLKLIDFERGAKISGSRFYIYNGQLAALERKLINFMLEKHSKKGYQERSIPLMVKDSCMQNTGQFPKFKEEYYHIASDQLNLIPTAEVPLTEYLRRRNFTGE